MPDILHTMTIILPNSALPWSRVNDHKKSGGRWQLSLLASVVISAFFLNTAYAWQQEYIVDTQPGLSTERYTWDSDHQPDYNDILSQRIQSSQRALGLEVNLAEETPVDVTSSMSMGWNFLYMNRLQPARSRHYITMAQPPRCITSLATVLPR